MKIVELSEQDYASFAEHHPCANFLNSIYSGRRFQKRGWNVVYLGAIDQACVKAAALIVSTPVHGGAYMYAPRGFLLDYQDSSLLLEFTRHLKQYAKQHNALYLKIDPYVPYQEHDSNGQIVPDGFQHKDVVANLKQAGFQHQGFTVGYDPTTQNRWMSILRLEQKTERELMEAMIPARHRMLKNGLRRGIYVRELAIDELNILHDVVHATCARQGFSDMPDHYYEDCMSVYGDHAGACAAFLRIDECLKDLYIALEDQKNVLAQTEENLQRNPESKKMRNRAKQVHQKIDENQAEIEELCRLQRKHGNEIPLSSAFYFNYGKEFVYLAGGSYEEYMKYRGSYAIQWYMIRKAMATGCHTYNFYGISGYFEKGQEGYGVFDFKRGFHAEVIELVGDFILPMKPLRYAFLEALNRWKQHLRRG